MKKSYWGDIVLPRIIGFGISVVVLFGLVAFLTHRAEKRGWDAPTHQFVAQTMSELEVTVDYNPNPFVPELGMADTSKPVYALLQAAESDLVNRGLPPIETPHGVVNKLLWRVVRAHDYDSRSDGIRRGMERVLEELQIPGVVRVIHVRE